MTERQPDTDPDREMDRRQTNRQTDGQDIEIDREKGNNPVRFCFLLSINLERHTN